MLVIYISINYKWKSIIMGNNVYEISQNMCEVMACKCFVCRNLNLNHMNAVIKKAFMSFSLFTGETLNRTNDIDRINYLCTSAKHWLKHWMTKSSARITKSRARIIKSRAQISRVFFLHRISADKNTQWQFSLGRTMLWWPQSSWFILAQCRIA